MSEVVVKIDNLHKEYKLGTIGGGTLTADLQSWWANIKGKEDPNSKIGEVKPIKNEKFMALNGINLEINKGDTIGIIGGNGAGKSTMLKILSRVTAPTKGSIKIKGRISSMLEVGTGFHGELTGRENIYLNGAILGMTKEEVDRKIDDIIEFSECGKFIDTPVKRYSSGMYVKLAFSVAAHLDSEILIMDEVLAVGDMKFQKKCIDKMIQVANDGRTVLYVSHNMQTVQQLCNRVVVLDKGTVKYDGDVDTGIEIYLNQNVSELSIYNDLRTQERESYLPKNLRAKLLSLEILDKEYATFYDGESLKCKLKWDNYDDLNDLQVRFEIRTSDGIPICASVSSKKIDCLSGTQSQYNIELDITRLASGQYRLLVVLAELDDFGNFKDVDLAHPACIFEVVHNKFNEYMFNWNKRYWGSIQLPDIKMENVDNLNVEKSRI